MIRTLARRVFNALGYEIGALPPRPVPLTGEIVNPASERIHYGSGRKFKSGWLNVDMLELSHPSYLRVDLVAPHPFPSDFFRVAFCEDFIEHLPQADSITFLGEAYRTLRPGGVLRLSTPSLEGVMAAHYPPGNFDTLLKGKREAFDMWGHRHFYSRDSLRTVAEHIGFRVEFVRYGQSAYSELAGLETRADQAELNLHAELKKLRPSL